MGWQQTIFEGLWVFEPKVFGDDRGYFFESFNQKNLPEELQHVIFVQDNEAKSSFGVIRGLHYQLPPFAQAKLVRVISGEVLDVVVDVRKGSKTCGKSFAVVLNDTNKKQLFVPKGFAHGYAVLSDEAIFSYKCDNYYSPSHEAGLLYNDPALQINWMLPEESILLAERDKKWPYFGQHEIFSHD